MPSDTAYLSSRIINTVEALSAWMASNRLRLNQDKMQLHTLVHVFVCSRLDFCNSSFYGVKASTVDRLQSIFNAAARLLLNVPKFAHISAAIRDTLHWLPVKQRIEFKISLLVRNCLVGSAPDYLRELCVPVATNEYSRKTHRIAVISLYHGSALRDLAGVVFQSPVHIFGTLCRLMFDNWPLRAASLPSSER